MPNKLPIIAAVITTFALTEIYRVRPLRKRAQANKTAALLLIDMLKTRTEQLDYLLEVMEKYDVELNEFDLIAIKLLKTAE